MAHLYFILFLSIASFQISSTEKTKKENQLPQFYFTSKVQECPLDSPELYYDEVGFVSLSTLLQESRVFFGVLMDNLEAALSDSEDFDELQEKWESFTKLMSDNFDMKSRRIEQMWDRVIITYETRLLPWEERMQRIVVYEILCGLQYEYLVLEAMVKGGLKEIISSLQKTFGNVIRELGDTVLHQGEGDPAEMMIKVEETLLEMEPNFVGRLLSSLLKNGRKLKESFDKGIPLSDTATFLTEPLQQIGILAEAYKEKFALHPTSFWKQMSMIMKSGTVAKTGDELYMYYSRNEGRLIRNMLNLIAMEKREMH